MGIFGLVQQPRMQVLGSKISKPMFLSSLPREIVLSKSKIAARKRNGHARMKLRDIIGHHTYSSVKRWTQLEELSAVGKQVRLLLEPIGYIFAREITSYVRT